MEETRLIDGVIYNACGDQGHIHTGEADEILICRVVHLHAGFKGDLHACGGLDHTVSQLHIHAIISRGATGRIDQQHTALFGSDRSNGPGRNRRDNVTISRGHVDLAHVIIEILETDGRIIVDLGPRNLVPDQRTGAGGTRSHCACSIARIDTEQDGLTGTIGRRTINSLHGLADGNTLAHTASRVRPGLYGQNGGINRDTLIGEDIDLLPSTKRHEQINVSRAGLATRFGGNNAPEILQIRG